MGESFASHMEIKSAKKRKQTQPMKWTKNDAKQ
jgi:hypothetical protein